MQRHMHHDPRQRQPQPRHGQAPPRGQQHRGPEHNGHHGRQRIEPHAERQALPAQALAQQHHAHGPADELDEDPHGQDGVDHFAQLEQHRKDQGRAAQPEQGDMGEALGGMQAAHGLEEVSVQRGRVGDARVAQHRGEHRREGDPQHQARGHHRGPVAVEPQDEGADDEGGVLGLPPGDHAQDRILHGQIDGRDAQDGDEDGPGDVALGIADLPAQVVHVVVAQVGVGGLHRGLAQDHPEGPLEVPGAGRVAEGEVRIEVGQPAEDEPAQGAQDAKPKGHRDLAQGRDPAIQEHRQGGDHRGRRQTPGEPVQGHQEGQVLREADGPRRHHQRRLDHGLPDEEERDQPAPARPVGFAQEDVAPPGLGHGRAELRPDEAVDEGQARPGDPGGHLLRAPHDADDHGQDHEGADAHHVDHVQGHGLDQRQLSAQDGRRHYDSRVTWARPPSNSSRE